MTQNTIISISPGRNRIGYAVLRDCRLLYYGGTSLSKYKTKETVLIAVEKFLKRVFAKYHINHLIIQKLLKQQESSALLTVITQRIKTVAIKADIVVREYSSIYIRQQVCQNEKPTKANTAKNLVNKYNELHRYFSRTDRWERKYYGYVFDAIATGIVYTETLKDLGNKQNV